MAPPENFRTQDTEDNSAENNSSAFGDLVTLNQQTETDGGEDQNDNAGDKKDTAGNLGNQLREFFESPESLEQFSQTINGIESIQIKKAKDKEGNSWLAMQIKMSEDHTFDLSDSNQKPADESDKTKKDPLEGAQLTVKKDLRLFARMDENNKIQVIGISGLALSRKNTDANDGNSEDPEAAPEENKAKLELRPQSATLSEDGLELRVKPYLNDKSLPGGRKMEIKPEDLAQLEPFGSLLKNKDAIKQFGNIIKQALESDFFTNLEFSKSDQGGLDIKLNGQGQTAIELFPGLSLHLTDNASAKISLDKNGLKVTGSDNNGIQGVKIKHSLFGEMQISGLSTAKNDKGQTVIKVSRPNASDLILPIDLLARE